jgi:DNA-binding transcriptional LysR family regulator
MDINSLVIFFKIAETSSFSKAASILEIPISTISRRITKLEEDIGHKLFLRTTRKISLTKEGSELYAKAKPHFDKLAFIQQEFNKDDEMVGEIRLTAPLEHRNYLVPKLIEFRKLYPNINLFRHFSNDIKNMIEDSFDFALRAGKLADGNFYAFKLYSETMSSYIHKDFFPNQIDLESLKEFDYCMMERNTFLETHDGKIFKPVKRTISNSIEFITEYAKQYPSIIYIPDTLADDSFIKLNIFKEKETSFQIVYLNKEQNKICKIFLDFFKQYKK